MSLEKEIAANTEAVQELTAVMKEVAANQAQILKAAKVAPKSDESDEDEAPKKAARRRDEDEDEAPRKKRAARDDDEDEAPRKKRAARDDDDEDEDEAPRKKRSRDADEDEEDEKPAKKARSRSDDDEDEKPAKKAASKKSSKDKGPSTATIRAAIADLMSDCDKGEEEDRNDFIEAMFDHLDVANAAEIDEKDFERVLAWIAKKKDGKKVKFD